MNVVAQFKGKVMGVVQKQEVSFIDQEKDEIYQQMGHISSRIHDIREKIDSAADINQSSELVAEEIKVTVLFQELDGLERGYFTFFNRLRELAGFEPLEGTKFTGHIRYDSYLF